MQHSRTDLVFPADGVRIGHTDLAVEGIAQAVAVERLRAQVYPEFAPAEVGQSESVLSELVAA